MPCPLSCLAAHDGMPGQSVFPTTRHEVRHTVTEAREEVLSALPGASPGTPSAEDGRLDAIELVAPRDEPGDEGDADLTAHLTAITRTWPGRMASRWTRLSRRHPTIARAIGDPFQAAWALLRLRWPAWLRAHPLFDEQWYVTTYGDVRGGRLPAWWHYVRHGTREGRSPSRYFDRDWYLRSYPDVRLSGMDPLDHYFRHGCWEGRDPGPRFATDWYLVQHPEVAAAGMNPLLHYMREGASLGYLPRPASPSGSRRRSVRGSPGVPPGSWAEGPTAGGRQAPGVGRRREHRPAAQSRRADAPRIRRLAGGLLPPGARVGVVTDGDARLLDLGAVDTVPLPQDRDGSWLSDPPRNDLSAIAHLESLRIAQFDHVLVPEPSLWLTMAPGLERHLHERYARLTGDGAPAAIFDCTRVTVRDHEQLSDPMAVVDLVRERRLRQPTVLDWESGIHPSSPAASGTLFAPPAGTGLDLPYADDSIDIVIVGSSDGRLAEARRVASAAVLRVPPSAGPGHVEVSWLADAREAQPLSASIVVPTWNDLTMLTTCLRTIEETVAHRLDVEVIVSDDGSDETFVPGLERLAEAYSRVKLVRSTSNGGYISAALAGAERASKEILVFLNNDTILLPAWLDRLLGTFRDHRHAGVVGGMLLYPDGRLQEAGCAIFRDGSATKVGYGDDDPTRSHYAHVRPVDYVSGALLATPRRLFEDLGGFDRAYGFGYYEDGDYCFRVRAAGHEVLYQPESVVVHVEGGTAGVDLTRGAKRFQAQNQALFIERWARELERQPVRPAPLDLYASRALVVHGRTAASVTA
jgi:GT2 family glycosyltransferase